MNIPIVPIAITGAFTAMTSEAKRIKKGEKIIVEFLPVIYPGEMNPKELNDLVKQKIVEAKEKNHLE